MPSARPARTGRSASAHFGPDTISHQPEGENQFVRMGEHFADTVLSGTPFQ